MTPKLIQLTNLPRVMLVTLPEGDRFTADTIGIGGGECCTNIQDVETGEYTHAFDNWCIVSKLSEVTEEWCKGVVEKTANGLGYKGYSKTPTVTFQGRHYYVSGTIDPIESFHSAIEAEGYYVLNPFQHPKELNNYGQGELPPYLYQEDLKVWQEFQSKTLPVNTLILEMI